MASQPSGVCAVFGYSTGLPRHWAQPIRLDGFGRKQRQAGKHMDLVHYEELTDPQDRVLGRAVNILRDVQDRAAARLRKVIRSVVPALATQADQ